MALGMFCFSMGKRGLTKFRRGLDQRIRRFRDNCRPAKRGKHGCVRKVNQNEGESNRLSPTLMFLNSAISCVINIDRVVAISNQQLTARNYIGSRLRCVFSCILLTVVGLFFSFSFDFLSCCYRSSHVSAYYSEVETLSLSLASVTIA